MDRHVLWGCKDRAALISELEIQGISVYESDSRAGRVYIRAL